MNQLVREGIFLPRTEELEDTPPIGGSQLRFAPIKDDGTVDMEAWRKQRAEDQSIGASEVATLTGTELQTRGSRYALYHKLKDGYKPETPDAETQQRFDLGHLMENTATAYFMTKNRTIDLVDPNSLGIRHRRIPKLVASIDRFAFLEESNGPRDVIDITLTKQWIPVEVKNVGEYMKNGWTSDSVPDHYYDQVQAQLLVTGKPCALVIAFFGGQRISIYTIQADPDRLNLIETEVSNFLAALESDDEPDPDGTEACTTTVKALTLQGTPKKTIEADDELVALVNRQRSEREIETEAAKSAIEYENRIRVKMGDAVKATHPLFTVLYSIVKADTDVVDEDHAKDDPKVIKARQKLADLLEEAKTLAKKVDVAKTIEAEALAPYTTTIHGNTRRLQIKWAK